MQQVHESMEADIVDYNFPTIWTPEEVFLEEIGKSINALYNDGKYDDEQKKVLHTGHSNCRQH